MFEKMYKYSPMEGGIFKKLDKDDPTLDISRVLAAFRLLKCIEKNVGRIHFYPHCCIVMMNTGISTRLPV